ncbi:hypothetical protein [Alkalibacillus silvisoli]|uniref:Type II secretion system protein n=1 Tax=Alkalibacillus silvisoli TaxID=392823 RepID=A0ABP3JH21_9BACI
MYKKGNEQGFALIIVLLIIAILGMLLPLVMSNLLNSAKEYQRTEEYVQLNKLEDMGVHLINEAIDQSEEVASLQTQNWIDNHTSTPIDASITQNYKNELAKALSDYDLDNGLKLNVKKGDYANEVMIDDILIVSDMTIVVNYSVLPNIPGQEINRARTEGSRTINLELES